MRLDALVDASVLAARFDRRFPKKQRTAEHLLEHGLVHGTLAVPQPAILEMVLATTQPLSDLDGGSLLTAAEAAREAEELLVIFPVLPTTDEVLRTALRGALSYGLPWTSALIWAHAEHYGLGEVLSEDLPHQRYYGAVRVLNPFAPAQTVHERQARRRP